MEPLAARYDRWKAPAEDGQLLLWPQAPDLLRDTEDNQRRLSSADSVRIQNIPLPELRRGMRKWLGHEDDRQPLVGTGHQTELHHPGVWVKNAVIDAIANRLGGRAVHFAVDTDEPKHLQLRWPGGSVPLTDDEAAARADWSALVDPPTPAHLRHAADVFHAAASHWSFRPMADDFFDSMRRLALESINLPTALTNSLHQLDWNLGLRHHTMTVSPMFHAEPYLVFVHHVLARADAFAADYNAALEQYRQENKIRTPGRPMPNLRCTADGCEVPFWLDALSTGTRSRASVVRSEGKSVLRLGSGAEFHFDPNADGWAAADRLLQFLRQHNLRLSPRALTLTAGLRLLVADQFVHGIGGGQYDQVLDLLIARHLKLEPPRFAVTTATLYFPEAVGQSRVCLPCVAQEGHRLKHSVLGAEKMKLVEAIAAAPRYSPERSQLFYRMHDRLSAAWTTPIVRDWEQRYEETARREQEERVLFDRELFYAIQPASRLTALIARCRGAFA